MCFPFFLFLRLGSLLDIIHEPRMEARAAQFANIGTSRLVSVGGRIWHASQRGIFQVRKVPEEFGKEKWHRIHFHIFRVIVHVSWLRSEGEIVTTALGEKESKAAGHYPEAIDKIAHPSIHIP